MPIRPMRVGIPLSVIAVLAVIVLLLVNIQARPEPYGYDEIISWFRRDRVQEFVIDLNNGELHISKMDGKPADIRYRLPDAGGFLEEVDPMVSEHNAAHPDQIIHFDLKHKS